MLMRLAARSSPHHAFPFRTVGNPLKYTRSQYCKNAWQDLTLERLGHAGSVAWLTMNKPERLNALSLPMIHSMWDALRQHFPPAPRAQESGYSQHLTRRPTGDDLDEPRLLVLGGAGGRAFCAGGDVRPIAERFVHTGEMPVDNPWISVRWAVALGCASSSV